MGTSFLTDVPGPDPGARHPRPSQQGPAPAIHGLDAAVYVVPTDAPESDGTLAWDETIMVLVTARAGDAQGIGWSYTAAAAQSVVTDVLAGAVVGRSALDVAGAAEAMARAVRNIGRAGIAAMAISAVDIALWDLKARLLGCSAGCGRTCPSTAAGASPATTTSRHAGSWPAGRSGTAFRESRSRSARHAAATSAGTSSASRSPAR